jgi:hypothetical protein
VGVSGVCVCGVGVACGFEDGSDVCVMPRRPRDSPPPFPLPRSCLITLVGFAFVIPGDITMWWVGNYAYLMWLESAVPGASSAAAA